MRSIVINGNRENKMKDALFFIISSILCVNYVNAYQVSIEMKTTDSNLANKSVGVIVAKDTKFGLLLMPKLQITKPGYYGFHVHTKPFCGADGKNAGGHLDPENTNLHLGPYGAGHLGDLPNLFVDYSGKTIIPILAPKLTVNDILNRTLVVHSKTDYYDNNSFINSGNRIICGIVPKTVD